MRWQRCLSLVAYASVRRIDDRFKCCLYLSLPVPFRVWPLQLMVKMLLSYSRL